MVPESGEFQNQLFADLPTFLRTGDLLVFNDSKVIPARLRGKKNTGGAVEILVERVLNGNRALVMLRSSKKPGAGSLLTIDKPSAKLGGSLASSEPSTLIVKVIDRDKIHTDRFVVDFEMPVSDVLDTYGELPLPPYITHDPTTADTSRYQTVYAQNPGSVAAPTAGLHFDEGMLGSLAALGVETARVTLHVGSGTFSPVRTENLSQHKMHSEWCSVSKDAAKKISRAKAEGRRVIAIGTTSLRTLESWAMRHDRSENWETDLFITPGYRLKLVDGLVTNFHLPKSTLLMLVSAFAGYDRIRQAYDHAIKNRYRFYSYGDAMLLHPQRY